MSDLRGLVLRIRRVGSIDEAYAILEQEVEQRQRDLAAKVEALADSWAAIPPYTASNYDLGRVEQREMCETELRTLLADALPQDADSEPASVPLAAEDDSGAATDVPGAAGLSEAQETCGLPFGDGWTCDLPKGHDEDETRDGGAGL